MNNRIEIFAFENGILQPEQLGFVKGNRTSDCLNILHALINTICKAKGNKIYAAFIDLEKGYDKIPREILLRKLNKLGINGNIFNVLSNMYQGDCSCVKICNKRTEYFDVNRGLKQGCALSPNLFNIFISDLPAIFSPSG